MSKDFYNTSRIPKNWKSCRLKYILSFSENLSLNPSKEKNLSLTQNGIIEKDISANEGQIAKSYDKYILVKKGQISMNPMDLLTGWVDISSLDGIISPAYYTFDIKKNFDVKFVNYFFQSNYYRKTFFKLGKGVASHDNFGRWVLSPEELKNIYFFYPNHEEQKSISKYLDNKTKRIDLLISKVKKKIELLKMQKRLLISHYITKGADKNAELIDSGLEWVGKMPKHWKMRKINHVTDSIGSGTTPKSDDRSYYDNGKYNWLVTGDLNDGVITKTSNKVSEKALSDYTSLKVYKTNSLMIAMYGATIGKLGISKIETSVNQATCVLTIDKVNDIEFWFYVLLGHREYIISQGYGGGQPNISQDLIKGLRFPSPIDLNEQKKIARLLNEKLMNHNKLTKKEINRLQLLNEYRKSLISNVVSGNIKI